LRDDWFKMVESKMKRNARRSKSGGNFQIRSKPIVHVAGDDRSPVVAEEMTLPRVYDSAILFVIAQDEHTIFASWNIDWRSVFENAMPGDRQVYLRLIESDGLEEKRVAVEPMAAMHYVTITGQHDAYRVEIGYCQPADAWHSVAISEEVKVPSQGSAEIAAADLATIPFHLRFQHLLDVLGTSNDTPLARAACRFQKRVLNDQTPNQLSPAGREILRELDLSLPQIAAAHNDFEKTDTEKLARHAAFLRWTATSPSRGFEAQ
jgi:hypothetical protein